MLSKLNLTQKGHLIGQYVDLIVDDMDTESLIEYVIDSYCNYYEELTDSELETAIEGNFGKEVLEELIVNVTTEGN